MTPKIKRRIEHMEKRFVGRPGSQTPRWMVMHLSYSDGSEVYEVYSLEGGSSYRRFATESELDAWLHKWENVVPA